MARTDRRGRAVLTGLRAYEPNRISLDVDDLPLNTEVQADELTIRPAAHSGASVRFPVSLASAGEVRVADESGAPLPAGTILVRERDLVRFSVGGSGRTYLSGVSGITMFRAEAPEQCQVAVSAAALAAGQPVICRERHR